MNNYDGQYKNEAVNVLRSRYKDERKIYGDNEVLNFRCADVCLLF